MKHLASDFVSQLVIVIRTAAMKRVHTSQTVSKKSVSQSAKQKLATSTVVTNSDTRKLCFRDQ